MSYAEDELIPISALQHFSFCPRQCALIHVERIWHENMLTAQGRVMHEKAHSGESETRGDIRIARGVALRSLEFGISGVADVVEFHRQSDGSALPFPVEYKLGKPKEGNCDRVQLCAQAVCLEAMLNIPVPCGALFYGRNRRREPVDFTEDLRSETAELCRLVHELIAACLTPAPIYNKRCLSCSLYDLCMPKKMSIGATAYIKRHMKEAVE
jgi:CRISPR-associated exonuclease Cas4